ncbi:UNVERIFIED_CONTAM: hypothetical protein FKN15_028563 [Acipenser sinensis]
MTAAKKCILVNWKSEHSPSLNQWWRELTSYCTPEKIIYSVRKTPRVFEKIWGPFINYIPKIDFPPDNGDTSNS